jgi:hypothetical protein
MTHNRKNHSSIAEIFSSTVNYAEDTSRTQSITRTMNNTQAMFQAAKGRVKYLIIVIESSR